MKYISLPIKGQGIIVFKNDKNNTTPIIFHIYDKYNINSLKIEFSINNIIVTNIVGTYETILEDINNTSGLINSIGAYYWFSLDSQNQTLYAGIGEPRIETIKYKYQFKQRPDDVRLQNKMMLETLSEVEIYSKNFMRISKDPITHDVIPLIVKNTNDITMSDVAKGTYLVKSNLSTTSQKLYDCISGSKFVLDDDDFPDFSKAIEHSINTNGCWCNTTLKNKSGEFSKENPNIYETYLRITLGKNNGESPGIPYVMEIWPVGHYSPIHNHASANAIIRVLYGEIHVKLFPFLCAEKEGIEEFGNADFKKDDITWISPTMNQTHQLVNLDKNTKTCITIQCYMYDEMNKTHYDFFDYIDESGNTQQYEPDSDMDFVLFKETMRIEWASAKKQYKNKTI